MKICIIGGGFVGSATAQLACQDVEVMIWDTVESKRSPPSIQFQDLNQCDLIFICVPTPMQADGTCYTAIVESVITQCRQQLDNPQIVVRSTVPIGFCDKYQVAFMPEFLTEANWSEDFRTCSNWIIGLPAASTTLFNVDAFTALINAAHQQQKITKNNITVISSSEAEAVKYFRNCFLATKVSFCNEFYNLCSALNIDYKIIQQVAASDTRIGLSHTNVPGPDGKTGFSGSCFPKDMASLKNQIEQFDQQAYIISACLARNNLIDRPDHDWKHDDLKGRATI